MNNLGLVFLTMMNKNFLSFIILGLGITISGILFINALAQTALNIQYPVKELGNCQNESACRTYCDKPENIKACVNFAEKNNLMSQEELEQVKKFIAIIDSGIKGPGGCVGKYSCEEYCNEISHIDECVSFAEKNNLIPPQELAEAKKVQAAIKRGVKPPACGNKNQCDVYCNEPDHMEECITFGREAGFIQGKELEDAQKMLAAIKRGVKPPPCKGKQACDEYCQNPEHMEACMNFALEAGFMNEQEKQDSQKMLQALKKGVKPPACKGKEECDAYCAEESHFEECMKFAEAAGFMTAEEAAMARKTGGKGPGNCKGREECEAFCNNPDNQETCFNFGKEHGLIPEEDLKMMEEGKQLMPGGQLGPGGAMPVPGEGQNFQPGPGMINPSNQTMPQQAGPGGCKGPDECKVYCQSHPKECQGFGPAPTTPMGPPAPGSMEGQMPSEGMMPPEGTMPPPGENIAPPSPGETPPPPN